MATSHIKLIVMESVYNEALHGGGTVYRDGQLIVLTTT